MHAFVTGAAGFIASNLVDALLASGATVVGWDNLSTGCERNLEHALKSDCFRLVRGDNLDLPAMTAAMAGADIVFHLAANADVRFGLCHPGRDLQQNTIATYHVLEAVRACNIRRLVFTSTGSVYGEAAVIPTPEDAPFPVQTSLYAASKVACEGMISAWCEGFGMEGYIFRLVSIMGPRYSHGHVLDFCRQLREHPGHLDVLGDGSQRKSYLHVSDCVAAILRCVENRTAASAPHQVALYNLGTNEYCRVTDSVEWITSKLGLQPELRFSGGQRGWVGDNPFIFLSTDRIRATGWTPNRTIRQCVEHTVEWIEANPWVLEIPEDR